MPNAYSALSGGSANTNGGLGGGQYTSADNVGTFTPSNGADSERTTTVSPITSISPVAIFVF